jgi:prepilin-type N-terminal cleavage/methylation domain-containing protein
MLSSDVRREEMRREPRAGFTLIELMISLTMLGIVLGALTTVMVGMQRGYTRQRETARSEDAMRNAELTISSILRYAGANPRNIPPGVNLPRIDPFQPPFDSLRVLADITNGANPPVPDADVADLLEDVLVFARNDTLYVRWQAGAAEAPVAWPVRTLLFQFDSSGTILATNVNAVRAAKRVRVTLEAPKHSRTTELSRRESWIYLRNRW